MTYLLCKTFRLILCKSEGISKNTKSYQTISVDSRQIQNPKSKIPNRNGGDDRIRTCEGRLTLNDLANRRFQPLSHVSVFFDLLFYTRKGKFLF